MRFPTADLSETGRTWGHLSPLILAIQFSGHANVTAYRSKCEELGTPPCHPGRERSHNFFIAPTPQWLILPVTKRNICNIH